MVEKDSQFHWSEGMKYAIEGIRSSFILNGVAAISVLTFLGNAKSSDDRLVYAMICFAVGGLLGPITLWLAYLTQLFYGNNSYRIANRWHNVTYIFAFLGIVCFGIGIEKALRHFWPCSFCG